jgi:uncharacterized protein
MNKKSFALSWGRKMFFGLGWALTSIVAMNYLQSMILPQSFGGWMYFLSTFIGHYGMILSLVYFLIFCPIILIFPTYYISRIWSILLILGLNVGIFFDSYLFSRYHFHLNSFLWDILKQNQTLDVFGLTPFKLGLLGFVVLIFFILFWIRGEALWRKMCGRFSNPVKNWYLAIIAFCFLTSSIVHMFSYAEGGGPITRIANLFPLNFAIDGKLFLKKYGLVKETDLPLDQHYGHLYYPANGLKCQNKSPKNLVMIVLENWPADWNQNQTPFLTHYKTHGLNFVNHYSGGLTAEEGYFSLLYSLPPIYSVSVKRQKSFPVFLDQVKKQNGELSFYRSSKESPVQKFIPEITETGLDQIAVDLNKRQEGDIKAPYFIQVYIGEDDFTQRDLAIKEVMNTLIKRGQIQKSIIIVTGTHSNKLKTPFYLIWPGRKNGEFTRATSHYDILGTILLEDWKCKNRMSDVGLGHSLFKSDESIKFVTGNYDHLMIIDPQKKNMAIIDESAKLQANGAKVDEMKIILDALNRMTMFYRPR